MNTMKKILVALLCATLLMSLSLPALAEEDDQTLTISGTANITLKPDYATLELGVVSLGATVKDAQQENATLITAVIEALKQNGLTDDDIHTSNFNVNTNYSYDYEKNTQTFTGYEVSNMLSVKVSDVGMVGTVLDAAMNAGANRSYGINFGSTAENDAYDKALTRAVEDARHKAEVLAAACGVDLVKITSINATSGGMYYGVSNTFRYDAKDAAAGTTILQGDVTVSATVTLTFQVR